MSPTRCGSALALSTARFYRRSVTNLVTIQTGIGEAKLERYGEAFMKVIRQYETGLPDGAGSMEADLLRLPGMDCLLP